MHFDMRNTVSQGIHLSWKEELHVYSMLTGKALNNIVNPCLNDES